MNKVISLLALIIPATAFSQVRADFTYAKFYAPGQGSYIETYFNFDGQSVGYKTLPSQKKQASLEATISFDQAGIVKAYEKYEVLGPELANPDSFIADFIDFKQFALPDGEYNLNISVEDLNDTSDAISATQPISVSSYVDRLFFSDVLFIQNMRKAREGDQIVKAGMNITPYVYSYFPTAVSKLMFYTELYNIETVMGDSAAAVVKYFVRDTDRNRVVNGFGGFKRFGKQNVGLVTGSLDISNLPTGNYILEFEAFDKNQTLVAKQQISFERVNATVQQLADINTKSGSFEDWVMNIQSRDSLYHMMMSLIPIASSEEQLLIMKNRKTADNNVFRSIIIDFWIDKNPIDPWSDYVAYDREVQKANAEFSTQNSPGYESDRGFVYLKYGAPNTIRKQENEPSSYPYHIWHYYKHPKRSDAKYIFYNTDLVTNEYRMLHSNVIGEVNNPRWKRDLERRNTPFGTVDDTESESHYGGWSEDLFEMPW